jgi:uncharacterized protein YlzI (FlbEa/FlbD family)
MKLFVKETTQVWINGKEYTVQAGIQEVDDNVALILLEVKPTIAEKVDDDKKKK